MKRFPSPLEKVHDVSLQQERIAQLEIARAKQQWDLAMRQEQLALQQLDAARGELTRQVHQPSTAALLRGLQAQVDMATEQVSHTRADVTTAQQAFQTARKQYQAIKARVDGLAQLIEQQRHEHRQAALREQQIGMDDVSASRWSRDRQTDEEEIRHG